MTGPDDDDDADDDGDRTASMPTISDRLYP
jgi:hypothetical protein